MSPPLPQTRMGEPMHPPFPQTCRGGPTCPPMTPTVQDRTHAPAHSHKPVWGNQWVCPISGENHWTPLADNPWTISGDNAWTIIGRKRTSAHDHKPVGADPCVRPHDSAERCLLCPSQKDRKGHTPFLLVYRATTRRPTVFVGCSVWIRLPFLMWRTLFENLRYQGFSPFPGRGEAPPRPYTAKTAIG